MKRQNLKYTVTKIHLDANASLLGRSLDLLGSRLALTEAVLEAAGDVLEVGHTAGTAVIVSLVLCDMERSAGESSTLSTISEAWTSQPALAERTTRRTGQKRSTGASKAKQQRCVQTAVANLPPGPLGQCGEIVLQQARSGKLRIPSNDYWRTTKFFSTSSHWCR